MKRKIYRIVYSNNKQYEEEYIATNNFLYALEYAKSHIVELKNDYVLDTIQFTNDIIIGEDILKDLINDTYCGSN